MIDWLCENWGTIVITLLMIGIVTAVIRVIYRNKKQGKSSCGGNCGHCPMGGSCHHEH